MVELLNNENYYHVQYQNMSSDGIINELEYERLKKLEKTFVQDNKAKTERFQAYAFFQFFNVLTFTLVIFFAYLKLKISIPIPISTVLVLFISLFIYENTITIIFWTLIYYFSSLLGQKRKIRLMNSKSIE